MPILPHAEVRIGEVARRLGLSQRTLARRLNEEGLTFSALLGGLRHDLADRYLADGDTSISRSHGSSAIRKFRVLESLQAVDRQGTARDALGRRDLRSHGRTQGVGAAGDLPTALYTAFLREQVARWLAL